MRDFGWALPAKGGERLYARLAARLKASRQPKKKVYYKTTTPLGMRKLPMGIIAGIDAIAKMLRFAPSPPPARGPCPGPYR
jgi:hypothetical protein